MIVTGDDLERLPGRGESRDSEYTDECQTERKRLLNGAAANGKQATGAPTSSKHGDAEVEDLIAALRRSVAAATVDPEEEMWN